MNAPFAPIRADDIAGWASRHGTSEDVARRRFLQAAAVYVNAFEKITGARFPLPDPSEPPLARVRRNLQPYLGKAA